MTEWIVSSSVLICAVLAVRSLCKGRLSCRARYALWLLVLARLLVPVQLFTASWGMSAPPLLERVTEQTVYLLPTERTELPASVLTDDGPISEELLDVWADDHARLTDSDSATVTYTRYAARCSVADVLRALWLAGAGTLALVLLGSNLRFARRLRQTRKSCDAPCGGMRVYVAEGLASPCLVGVLRPAVYLTPACTQDERVLRHVLAHETTHRLHGDCLWSLLRLAALCLHWYNPLAWYAVIVSKRDGELACDEATLARLGETERIAYGETLLSLVLKKADSRELLSVTTSMTAGKRTLRERIETIARRPCTRGAALALALTMLACATALAFSEGEAEKPAPMTAEDALDALEASVAWWDDGHGTDYVAFTIPEGYEHTEDWNLHIAGRAVYEDGMSMSRHFFEGEAWKAGGRYTIEINHLTGLTMQAVLTGLDGSLREREIDLLPENRKTVETEATAAADARWEADLDGDGTAERIVLETETLLPGGETRLRIETAEGMMIDSVVVGLPHAGWNTAALADLDSGTYLLFYHPTMYQGEADYVFSLASVWSGALVTEMTQQVAFSANPGRAAENDLAAMRTFQEQANALWQRSRLLFTTDREVLDHLYDAGTGQSVPTNGAYYIASADETVRYHETMYGLLDEAAQENSPAPKPPAPTPAPAPAPAPEAAAPVQEAPASAADATAPVPDGSMVVVIDLNDYEEGEEP